MFAPKALSDIPPYGTYNKDVYDKITFPVIINSFLSTCFDAERFKKESVDIDHRR